jgi:hypothetical protein
MGVLFACYKQFCNRIRIPFKGMHSSIQSNIISHGLLSIFKSQYLTLGISLHWDGGLIDWLINYLLFYVPLKNFSLIWRRHHYRWRAIFMPPLGSQGVWASRDLYRATSAVTSTGPRFFRSPSKDRPIQSPLTTHKGMWRVYSNPVPVSTLIFGCLESINASKTGTLLLYLPLSRMQL